MQCDDVRRLPEFYIEGAMSSSLKTEIKQHLTKCMSCRMDIQVGKLLVSSKKSDAPNPAESAEGAPTTRLVNRIIQQAIEDTASEIVVESNDNGVQVRYRVGEELHTMMQIPEYAWQPVVARCLSLAGLDTGELEDEQEGHFPVQWDSKDYDLSVFCLPTPRGEKIIIKITGIHG